MSYAQQDPTFNYTQILLEAYEWKMRQREYRRSWLENRPVVNVSDEEPSYDWSGFNYTADVPKRNVSADPTVNDTAPQRNRSGINFSIPDSGSDSSSNKTERPERNYSYEPVNRTRPEEDQNDTDSSQRDRPNLTLQPRNTTNDTTEPEDDE